MTIVFQLQYQVADQQGGVHQCQEANKFVGTLQGAQLQAVCNEAQWVMDGQQMQPTLPMTLKMTLQSSQAAAGTCTLPNGQAVKVTMNAN